MKKLLAIAPYNYLPWYSGGQKFVAQFFEYLGKETDLTVVTVAENDFTLAKGYKIIPLLKKRSFSRYTDTSLMTKITALVKKEKFDSIIWEHPYYAWLAYRVKKNTGIKTIIHTHNIEHQRFRSTGKWWWWILKFYERWCLKKADHIFFITPEDKDFAISKWKIKKEKCIEVPFGVSLKEFPSDRPACMKIIKARHDIKENEKILFFNGLLDYKPNLDALLVILNKVNPILLQQPGFKYKIIICGKRLPAEMNGLKDYADKNIIYAGFVDDIETYYKGTDLFLNPVQGGGGIKTKMVEAIAYGLIVIATETGATGINKQVCSDNLIIVPDNDWEGFANNILSSIRNNPITPRIFYEHYYWENIIRKALSF